MKMVIITGSPHAAGTTAYLADEFTRGAAEAGHAVVRFDAARLHIQPCLGCGHCRQNGGQCVRRDDMAAIYPHLPDADAIVLVSPLYYFGMTAQLKTVIDRFYAVNAALRRTSLKAYLIAAGADDEGWAMDALRRHFETMCRYLQWQNAGTVLALGAPTRAAVEDGAYAAQAREMGRRA